QTHTTKEARRKRATVRIGYIARRRRVTTPMSANALRGGNACQRRLYSECGTKEYDRDTIYEKNAGIGPDPGRRHSRRSSACGQKQCDIWFLLRLSGLLV